MKTVNRIMSLLPLMLFLSMVTGCLSDKKATKTTPQPSTVKAEAPVPSASAPAPAPVPVPKQPEIKFVERIKTLQPISSKLISDIGKDKISEITFYLSDGITLERDNRGTSISTNKGAALVQTSIQRAIVEFQSETPGDVIRSNFDRNPMTMEVCFEEDDSLVLRFIQKGSDFVLDDSSGTITYGGESYKATYANLPRLLVNIDSGQDVKQEIRTVKGRPVK